MKLFRQIIFCSLPRYSFMFFIVFFLFTWTVTSIAGDWVYTVKTGDNLWVLSKKHLKSMRYWKQLMELNNVDNPYNLQPGTRLQFPMEWLKSGTSVATIVELTGEATIIGPNNDQPIQARKGMLLWDNDILKTSVDANATLQFADGSQILVQAESEMKVEELVSYGESGFTDTKVRLQSGRTHNNVVPRKSGVSRFEISTPSAIAAVRGTEYRISAEDNGESRTEVLTGAVGVDSSGSSNTIWEGFGTVSFTDKQPLAPVKLLPPPDLSNVPDIFYRVPFSLAPGKLDGAKQFRLQIARDAHFSTLLVDTTFPTENLWGPDLPDDTYFLRVNGIDGNGLEGLYSVHSFSIDAHPLPPIQIHPPAGAVIDKPEVEFKWSKPEDASRYQFQLSHDNQFKGALIINKANHDKTTFNPGLELLPGTHYWRVASVSAKGKTGPFSDPQEFRRAPPQPDMSDAELDLDEMVFQWRKAEPGQTFKCQISRNSDFSDLLVDEKLTEPRYSLKQLDHGSYYIRIAIIDADGYTGPFGAYQTVEVAPPPPHPLTIIMPVLLFLILIF